MDYGRIIEITLLSVAAVWYVYRTQYLPWKLKQNEQKQNHEIQASDDTREYYQTREANAFSQTLAINEKLVQVLIDISDKKIADINQRLDDHEKIFYTIGQHINRGASAIETTNRERVQMSEQQGDIDMELHTITELLRAALRNNGNNKAGLE